MYLTNLINFRNYVTQIFLFREYSIWAWINIARGCYFISAHITILYNDDILFQPELILKFVTHRMTFINSSRNIVVNCVHCRHVQHLCFWRNSNFLNGLKGNSHILPFFPYRLFHKLLQIINQFFNKQFVESLTL